MTPAPVLLFTYNRPTHTRQTLEVLLRNELSRESELFVFSDGYKNDTDKEQVMQVRRVIHAIEGFRKVYVTEQPQNVGLAKNVIDGVTRVINVYGRAIVLEDDLLTSPQFLTFMNEALEMFAGEDKIGHIHGFCFPLPDLPDAFLIRWAGSWGWATWQRAWQQFNPDGEALLTELKRRKLQKEFDFNGNYPFTRMLKKQVRGENDSWAIRWNASLFLNNMLSLNAGKSLVQNIGFDGSGTHSGKDEIYVTSLHEESLKIEIPLISENKLAREAFEQYYKKTNSFRAKLKRRLKY